ncbi:MAG TPA: hypothetical protein VHX60_12005 [Acidobacteriaceae bacterium]|jgi:hypothetical protein|nr:hypothetical protein [Acidobacteriaceae bacterium]
MILSSYLTKVVYETVATPVTYAVVAALKRAENVDAFDRATNFNPFARTSPNHGPARRIVSLWVPWRPLAVRFPPQLPASQQI